MMQNCGGDDKKREVQNAHLTLPLQKGGFWLPQRNNIKGLNRGYKDEKQAGTMDIPRRPPDIIHCYHPLVYSPLLLGTGPESRFRQQARSGIVFAKKR